MREQQRRWILASLLLVLGCAGIEVSQDFDENASFAGLKTFAWQSENQAKTGDIRVDNPLLDARIRAAVQRDLIAKGFRKGAAGTVDFTVSYVFQIRRSIGSNRVRTGVGIGFGGSGSIGTVGVSKGSGVSEHDEGMLVIDINTPDSRKLLWRGTGIRRMSRGSDPDKITAEVDETVGKILAQFPPQPQ